MLTDYQLRETHGVAMGTTWGAFSIVGALIARYCKHYPWWTKAHRACVGVGFIMTLPLTFLAFYSHVDAHYGTYHGKLGLSVACMSVSQGLLGTVLFGRFGCGPCEKPTPPCINLEGSARAIIRKYVARLHRLLGWLTILLAFTTIFFGLWAFSCEVQCRLVSDITYYYFGYLAMLITPLCCLEFRHRKLKRHIRIQVPLTPHASMEGMMPVLPSDNHYSNEPLLGSVEYERGLGSVAD